MTTPTSPVSSAAPRETASSTPHADRKPSDASAPRERAAAFRSHLARAQDGRGGRTAVEGRSREPREALADLGEASEPKRVRPRRERDGEQGGEGLEPFRPPSPILSPPMAAPVRDASSGAARAEAAALAERMVVAMRVGRVGTDGHVVQLRLRAGSGELDVRLRHEGGRLSIVLAADAAAIPAASRLEGALRSELASRGLEVDEVRIEAR
jgi:hypothetical protein